MGGGEHMDYTVIGDGVNLASRLENACNPYKITISESSLKYIDTSQAKGTMYPCLIGIKHEKELRKAYEFSPVIHQKDNLTNLKKNLYEAIKNKQANSRFSHKEKFNTL